MKIKGPNGVVIDIPEHVATGLVGGGHCTFVDEVEAATELAASAVVAKSRKAKTKPAPSETQFQHTIKTSK